MKRNALLPFAAIVLFGSLSMASTKAQAALSCPSCQEIYDDCIAQGNSPAYCQTNQPGACYGCGPYLSSTTQEMNSPDKTRQNPSILALIGKEILQLETMA